jgi:hypothetical protein
MEFKPKISEKLREMNPNYSGRTIWLKRAH